MEIAAEDSFRIRSYRNGATAVEGHPERIADILRDPARKVTDISGIGKGLAQVLAEIIERQSCERRDALLEKFPPGALEFLKIQGLGPKSIALIFEHFQAKTIDDLERLCNEQKLHDLRGLDDTQRAEKLNDDAFLNGLSPDDRQMLRDLSNLRISGPEPPE